MDTFGKLQREHPLHVENVKFKNQQMLVSSQMSRAENKFSIVGKLVFAASQRY